MSVPVPTDCTGDGLARLLDSLPARHRAALRTLSSPTRPGRTTPSVLDTGSVARADLVRPVDQLARRGTPALPVDPALEPVLPEGLRRGGTVSVAGSMSLVFALLGAASTAGSWCALVGLPAISAEAAEEYGLDLSRTALVPQPGTGWVTAVGALLDAVDVVVVRPPDRMLDADVRRLAARVRGRDAVLMPFLAGRGRWPGAEVVLEVADAHWTGLGSGHGRLHARQVTVTATGRGGRVRPRRTTCWLPASGGGIAPVVTAVGATTVPTTGDASVVPLAQAG